MIQVVDSVADWGRCLRDDLNHTLVELILNNGVVLMQKLWRLPKPLDKTHEPPETQFTMVLAVEDDTPSTVAELHTFVHQT